MYKAYTYSRTPLISNNWDDETSRYAENPDNWIFLWKYAHWQFEFRLLLFTVCTCV